jgi:plastocyanin
LRWAICNLLIAVAVLGCDDRQASVIELKRVTPGNGQIVGKVSFGGTVVTPAKIDNSICHGAAPIVDEAVVTGKENGLANVIVSVAGVSSATTVSNGAVELDQKDCRFSPHIVAVRTGQTVKIKNSDSEAHNVHANPAANLAFNVGLTSAGASKDVMFAVSEVFRVKCDVHPWMTAYIGVFDSDYYAVTNADGEFEIKGLPPGSYELVAWHERFGELRKTVTVSDGRQEANFAYEPPK